MVIVIVNVSWMNDIVHIVHRTTVVVTVVILIHLLLLLQLLLLLLYHDHTCPLTATVATVAATLVVHHSLLWCVLIW